MSRHISIALLFCASACFDEPGPASGDTGGSTGMIGASDMTAADGSTTVPSSTGTEDTTSSTDSASGADACVRGAGDCEPGYCVDGACVDLPAGFVEVPEGIYPIGCAEADTACEDDELPLHDVFLSAFAIGEHETTVAQYTACVDAGACEAAGDDTLDPVCNFGDADKEDHPINCVTWQDAMDYCSWIGATLPTESQWEAAARGTDGRIFPWGGGNVTCDFAVVVTEGIGCGTGETWPVGSKPDGASPFGALDMTGNVAEWVADWYAADAYASAEGEVDPAGPRSGEMKAHRGGALTNGMAASLRTGRRTAADPSTAEPSRGFRCVLAR